MVSVLDCGHFLSAEQRNRIGRIQRMDRMSKKDLCERAKVCLSGKKEKRRYTPLSGTSQRHRECDDADGKPRNEEARSAASFRGRWGCKGAFGLSIAHIFYNIHIFNMLASLNASLKFIAF